MTNQITLFKFNQSYNIRTLTIAGEPWFVAKDIAEALEYRDAANLTRNLDEDEKGTHIVSTLGGSQEMTIINESGLYTAILRSKKPEAKHFKKWVTSEVLPSIRKTGSYAIPRLAPPLPTLTREQQKTLGQAINRTVCGWPLSTHSAEMHMYNLLRVTFNISSWQQVPQEKYQAALDLVESKHEEVRAFRNNMIETVKWFKKEVLGNGVPWTPTLARDLNILLRQRGLTQPTAVDWRALSLIQ